MSLGKPIRKLCHAGLLLLGLSGCFVEHQWTFSATRSVYGDQRAWTDFGQSLCGSSDSPEVAMAAAGLVVLPLMVDLIIMPVTLPRDLWVAFKR